MDGKINRIKVMLVDKGKTNRWLAMQDSYIAPALTDGSIERKYPEQPNHPKQMYCLKEKAKTWKKLDVF